MSFVKNAVDPLASATVPPDQLVVALHKPLLTVLVQMPLAANAVGTAVDNKAKANTILENLGMRFLIWFSLQVFFDDCRDLLAEHLIPRHLPMCGVAFAKFKVVCHQAV